MLAAHMDEIGLMVQYVDEHGFIRFVAIGGWFNPVLVSQRVLLHGEKGTVPGVLGMKPPHVMSEDDRKKPVSLADMFIDVGATSPEEVEALGITIGTPITIDREFWVLRSVRRSRSIVSLYRLRERVLPERRSITVRAV